MAGKNKKERNEFKTVIRRWVTKSGEVKEKVYVYRASNYRYSDTETTLARKSGKVRKAGLKDFLAEHPEFDTDRMRDLITGTIERMATRQIKRQEAEGKSVDVRVIGAKVIASVLGQKTTLMALNLRMNPEEIYEDLQTDAKHFNNEDNWNKNIYTAPDGTRWKFYLDYQGESSYEKMEG